MGTYQALYRKYRPQTFDDVSGQLAVTQTLKTQLSSQLKNGNLAAHDKIHLMLLGSPPDMVHGISLRKTNLSTPLSRADSIQTSPGVGIHPCCSGLQA